MNSSVLVDRNGNFNRTFEESLDLATASSPAAVVSIIGGQSSGKSTLLNHLFDTKFEEMDAARGRFQTTKGIWVAKGSLQQGCTIVIDTEGSDGQERQDDENFDKQMALFALAISNVVIINMMCTDLGKYKGAGWPLLRTALEVMLRRFSTPREVTLLFVLRDKTDSPFEVLEKQLKEELYKMWNEMTAPQAQGNAALAHLIKVKVVATSYYLRNRDDFLKEVDNLREWIMNYTTSGGGAAGRIVASGFTEYAATIWDEIKKDKDLNLPSYKTMVAEIRCNSIAKEKLEFFCKNKSWLQMKKDVESGEVVQGFGKTVNSLIDDYLSQYDEEALHYDEAKRTEISKQLTENLLQTIEPTYLLVAERMRKSIVDHFQQAAFEELKCNGVMKDTQPCDFITEFRNQLQDVAIERADWDHTTEQLALLESEILRYIGYIRLVNEHFQDKKQQREFWLKVATITGRSVFACFCVAASVVFPMALGGTVKSKASYTEITSIVHEIAKRLAESLSL